MLGKDLADKLGAKPGDVLRLVALGFGEGRPRFRYQSLRVSGTFATGFAEFDRSWVLLDRALVERLMGGETADGPPGVHGRRSRGGAAHRRGRDGRSWSRTSWSPTGGSSTASCSRPCGCSRWPCSWCSGLIVLVSTFNVASTLVVLVRERMRDIGLLGALGLRPGKLRLVFLVYGGFLGAFGTLLGVLAGWGICWVLTTFELIRFDPEVAAIYFISSVPFRVEPRDLLAIVGFALLVTLLACLIPAWRAARVDPSSALRYE